MPYQCSMLVIPSRQQSHAFVSSTPMWVVQRSPSSRAVAITASRQSRSMVKILSPSAPRLLSSFTCTRSASGVVDVRNG